MGIGRIGKRLGIRLTDRLDLVQAVAPALVAIVLGRYAFSVRPRIEPVVPLEVSA